MKGSFATLITLIPICLMAVFNIAMEITFLFRTFNSATGAASQDQNHSHVLVILKCNVMKIMSAMTLILRSVNVMVNYGSVMIAKKGFTVGVDCWVEADQSSVQMVK